MKNSHNRYAFAGALVVLSQSLFAASLSPQPVEVAVSNQASLYQGYGSQELVTQNYFTASFEPFDDSLGILQSFTVRCRIGGALQGLGGNAEPTGFASIGEFGGSIAIGGMAFGGTGTGGVSSNFADSGELLEAELGTVNFEQNLAVANAGFQYDPGILTAVSGSAPFPISFNIARAPETEQFGVKINYTNVADLEASMAATISITYVYQPVAGGAPESFTVTGIVRNTAAENVSVEWTSSDDKSYTVDASENLDDWFVIAPVVPGAAGTTSFVEESVPATIPRRFYRIRERD